MFEKHSTKIIPGAFALGAFIFVGLNLKDESRLLEKEISPIESHASAFDSLNTINENLTSQKVTHIETPEKVRGIYMTSWIAGEKNLREEVIDTIDDSNGVINAIVIDIKDYTGRVAFPIEHSEVEEVGSAINRVKDMEQFIARLHEKGIYVIGRVAVFQDDYLPEKWPSEAVQTPSGELWQDDKKITWLDPGSTRVWEYIADVAEHSYAIGFDEINFDYIRFPSDGAIKNARFPYSQDRERRDVMRGFFSYLHARMEDSGIPHSADVFGMTVSARSDLGIGQVLEDFIPYFTAVSPMIYPSHFPDGWQGIERPDYSPGDVIFRSAELATLRLEEAGFDNKKIRFWLQDFSIGKKYTPADVKEQIEASERFGFDSWLIWNPSNRYNSESFNIE